MRNIILASTSPRRKKLLKMIGLNFEAIDSGFQEVMDPKKDPHQLAQELSLGKARKAAKNYKNAIIISADTFIVINKGEYLSKVYNSQQARKMLEKLSGGIHLVITGFTVIDTKTNKTVSKSVETKIYFKKLTEKEIDAYIKSKEPIGVVIYRIQGKGSLLIKKIEGDYYNVVGLPLFALVETLEKFGIKPLEKSKSF